jgi:hypothetical protein
MRKIALLCLILLPLISPAQEESSKRYVHKGLLSGDASIAPGMLLKQNVSTVSIPGTLEYFWDEHVSIKADIYYQANAGLSPTTNCLWASITTYTPIQISTLTWAFNLA